MMIDESTMSSPVGEFQFETSSSAFLRRAEALLTKFDETDDAASLLYAALELRSGIEARLWEYITFQAPGTVSRREYRARVMLAALCENAFATHSSSTLVFRMDGYPPIERTWTYVPVTDALVKMHDRLGGYLHASLFYRNPQIRRRTTGSGPEETFLDIRQSLAAIANELATVISGNRLGPWDFSEYCIIQKRILRRLYRSERLKERAETNRLKGDS